MENNKKVFLRIIVTN